MRQFANRRWLAALILLVVLAAIFAAWALAQAPRQRSELGLVTTLPIYWDEAAGIEELLQREPSDHWVREELSDDYRLVPLDTLDQLPAWKGRRLLLAQPGVFSPNENLALDNWVRAGGHVLLFADPLLTEESRFSLGDRRRPQGAALLSPILTRWGLELRFDEKQPDGLRAIDLGPVDLPVELSGEFRIASEGSSAPGVCRLLGGRVIASCAVGSGRVVAVADAAVLARAMAGEGEDALDYLLETAFADAPPDITG